MSHIQQRRGEIGVSQNKKYQTSNDNEYYINNVVESAIISNLNLDNRQKNAKTLQNQKQNIPIKFSGDLVLQTKKNEPNIDEIDNFDDIYSYIQTMITQTMDVDQQLEEIQKVKNLNELDLDQINEDITQRMHVIEKSLQSFIKTKQLKYKKEATFLRYILDLLKNNYKLQVNVNWKLRESSQCFSQDINKLKKQTEDFMNALGYIKSSKGMKDYDLFGKTKLTEEQLQVQFHQISTQLKIQDQELAVKQAKFVDEIHNFVKKQETKIQSKKQKINSLNKELENIKKYYHEQLQRAYIDNQEVGRLTEYLKEKLEAASYKQDNHLENLFLSRQKILNDELEKESKEKQEAIEKLSQKKEENNQLREQIAKLQGKKVIEQGIQCNIERDEKLKYHSRPKAPLTNLGQIFEDVLMGTTQKKIPTSKQSISNTKNIKQTDSKPISSGSMAVIQSKEWVQAQINMIYIDKIKNDMEDFKDGKPIQSLRDFVIQWFLVRYGIKKIAEALLQDFIKSLVNYEPIHERFRTFLIFCGVHVQKNYSRQREKKGDLLYEKQLESVDTLRIYLKLIHTIRNGCTPFLPDINCDSQQRNQNGVVIPYLESKQIFLQIMSEEGYANDVFSNIDQPFQEFLEEQTFNDFERSKKSSLFQQSNKSSKRKDPLEDKQINIDVFLRICILEYVKMRLLQIDQVLSAVKIMEYNNYCDILYNDFESAVKVSLYNKSEKWIEGAFTYLINNLEDSFFTREDVIITLLPWIHQTAFTKEYTVKHKSWVYYKELERLKVIDISTNQKEENKTNSINTKSKFSNVGTQQKQTTSTSINLSKSIVPGTKVLKDPLSSCYLLEQNFKLMANFFQNAESDLKEISQQYHSIIDKITSVRKLIAQNNDEDNVSLDDNNRQKQDETLLQVNGSGKIIKTCRISKEMNLDPINESWNLYRRLLQYIVSKHKNLDI